MKCKNLASYIHCHHPHQHNSSCPCRMMQDTKLGIQIHCYQEVLAIDKMLSCQILIVNINVTKYLRDIYLLWLAGKCLAFDSRYHRILHNTTCHPHHIW
jgi:hypothetical protein